jgi:hypothetical protein
VTCDGMAENADKNKRLRYAAVLTFVLNCIWGEISG